MAARGAGTGAGAGVDDAELGAGEAAPGVLLVGERLTGAAVEMLVRATPFVMSRMPAGLTAAGAAATAGADALAALAESAGATTRQDKAVGEREEEPGRRDAPRVAWSTVNLMAPTAARVRR